MGPRSHRFLVRQSLHNTTKSVLTKAELQLIPPNLEWTDWQIQDSLMCFMLEAMRKEEREYQLHSAGQLPHTEEIKLKPDDIEH